MDISRGASVSLGDDVPDPGMVQDGTKCDENKVILHTLMASVTIPTVNELHWVI
jgi:hypothetical protein